MDKYLVAIDAGSTKICTLIGRVEIDSLRILGVGIEPAQGIKHGLVVEPGLAAQAIQRSVRKAEYTSGLEIKSALVSLSGAGVASLTVRAAVPVRRGIVEDEDIERVLEAAGAIALPADRQIIHVLPGKFTVDGREGITMPTGMHGSRLEVDAQIVTAPRVALEVLSGCLAEAGVRVQEFVLSSLASARTVTHELEREMGVVVCDLGGGTTDLVVYKNGIVSSTAVLPVGGDHITADIALGLHLTLSQAEEVKKRYGSASLPDSAAGEYLTLQPLDASQPVQISRRDLVNIIEPRVEEIFEVVLREIKRDGEGEFQEMTAVLAGGGSSLPGIRGLAGRVLGMPVRVGNLQTITGLADALDSPAYATAVGLLRWAPQDKTRTVRRSALQKENWFRRWLSRLAGDATTDAPPPDVRKK